MRRILAGAFIALGLPIALLAIAQLVEAGIAPYDQVRAAFLGGPLGGIALGEVFLAPGGLYVAGRGAGIRGQGPGPWIAVFVIGLPVLAFIWFMSLAILSGAVGEPM